MTLEQSTHDLIDNRTGRDERRQRSVDLVSTVWRWLLSPWTLFSAGTATLILLPAAFFLPQLPGQLNDEPAAAARWLLAAGAAYGALGNTLRVAGLFNLLGSLLFRTLLAFITLLVALHFADCLGKAFAVRTLMARFGVDRPTGSRDAAGWPSRLSRAQGRRWPPSALAARIAASMAQRYGYLARHETGEFAGARGAIFGRASPARTLRYYRRSACCSPWRRSGTHCSPAGTSARHPCPGQAYAPAQDLLIQYLVDRAQSRLLPSLSLLKARRLRAALPGARLRTGNISLRYSGRRRPARAHDRAGTAVGAPGQTDRPSMPASFYPARRRRIIPAPSLEESCA